MWAPGSTCTWKFLLELGAQTSGGKHLWEAQLFCGLNSEAACTKERCFRGHTLQQLSWSSSLLFSGVCGLVCLALPPSLHYIWSDPWPSSPNQQKNLAERKERVEDVLGCLSQLMGSQTLICSGHQGETACNLCETYHLMTPAKFFPVLTSAENDV